MLDIQKFLKLSILLESIDKLMKTRLINPQDDGLESVVNLACWGSVSRVFINLSIPDKGRFWIAP